MSYHSLSLAMHKIKPHISINAVIQGLYRNNGGKSAGLYVIEN